MFPQQFQVLVQAHFLKKERFGFNQKSILSEIRLRMNLGFIQNSLEFTGARVLVPYEVP